jgi:CubicO group peptidase (beta-lactamase class C family)
VSSADRLRTVLTLPLEAQPGASFRYSCLGYVVAGVVMERVTGMPLRELMEHRLLRPLGLADTGFGPYEGESAIAASEYQPWTGRGILRGDVHDETAWALGGAAGNAGLFSTLRDVARFGEIFHADGTVDGRRILSPEAVATMIEPVVRADVEQFDQGVGFRIDAQQFMGTLAFGGIGHTGFTGTSIVIHRDRGVTAVLLSNRVHPSRQGFDASALRRDVADAASRAVAAAT